MELSSAMSPERDAHAGIGNTSHDRIRLTATVCWKLFERCTKTSPAHLSRDYGRFRVWCGNLGVRQGGHGSLDWTLKDDEVTEKEVFSMLKDLADDLLQSQYEKPSTFITGSLTSADSLRPTDWSQTSLRTGRT